MATSKANSQYSTLPEGFSTIEVPYNERDVFGELNKAFPGATFSSGYRTKEYQEDMRRRGYKPADNSAHLDGDAIDITSFPGMSLAQGAAELRRQHPNAKILYGDSNHKDHVHFIAPGYGGFQAMGGAAEAGNVNPTTMLPEGFEELGEEFTQNDEPLEASDVVADTSELPEGFSTIGPSNPDVITPEMVGGVTKGSEIQFNVDADTDQVWNREDGLQDAYQMSVPEEANIVDWLNANSGNKKITREDVVEAYARIAPGSNPLRPEDVELDKITSGKYKFGGFELEEKKKAYIEELRAKNEEMGKNEDELTTLSAQGILANFSDEVAGALGAAKQVVTEGDLDIVGNYKDSRNQERQAIEDARDQQGLVGTAVELLSSIPTALLVPMSRGTSIGKLAGSGAIDGAVFGAGRGANLNDSLGTAVTDAAIGTVAAPVLGKAVEGVGALTRKFSSKPTDVITEVRQNEVLARARAEEAGEIPPKALTPAEQKVAAETRTAQIKQATEYLKDVPKGSTKSVQPFPDAEPDYFRFNHKTQEGKDVKGFYTFDKESGVVDNLNIWETNSSAVGEQNIRKIAKDLQDQHPDAHTLKAFRKEGSRKANGKEDFIEIPLTRNRRRMFEENMEAQTKDTEGPALAPTADEVAPDGSLNERALGKLQTALDNVKPLREEQDALRRELLAEKAEKIRVIRRLSSGESGFFKELASLKGEVPKVDAPNIRGMFEQEDVDALFNMIKESDAFGKHDVFGPMNARKALSRLLGAEGVKIPTEAEIALLGKIFPKELVETLGQLRPVKDRVKEGVANALNLPRAFMSTLDLSAPLRQGVFLVGRKQFYKSFASMFKSFGSEKAYQAIMEDISNRPSYNLMQEYKLAITDMDGALSNREEDFMTNWAEKAPLGAGKLVRASNRAYAGFLNKVRADVFDDILSKAAATGNNLSLNDKAMKDLAGYINNATGRGYLGTLETSAPLLNAMFFSPRLISARLALLNPVYYVKLDPVVRKEAVRDLLSFGALASSVLGIGKMGGAEVETDPRSTNFAKIKVGDTRYDVLGGFQQYLRLGAVLASNQTKDTQGDIQQLGEGYKADTRYDMLLKFAESKLSPVASYITGSLKGKDFLGQDWDYTTEAVGRMTPMFMQDVYEAYQDGGLTGAAMTTPGLFGVGVTTYPTAIDDFGNTVVTGGIDTPVYKEVERLKELKDSGERLIGPPSRTVEGEKLSDEDYTAYKNLSGKYIYSALEDAIADPEWDDMSDDEQFKVVDDIKSKWRKAAREDLFSGEEDSGELPEGFSVVQ